MVLSRLLTGVALVALMAQPVLAQTTTTEPQQPAAMSESQELAQQDMEFATKAAGDGMAEVKLGELAQQQAESDEVKQFGQRMVEDHTKAGDELKAIAEAKGIDLPQDMPEEAQQAYDELQQKSGHEFEQAYMDAMVEDHEKAVELFQQEANSGQDAELKSFAETTLPTLQEHLDQAQQVQEQVVAAADEGTGTGMSSDQPAASAAQVGGSAAPATTEAETAETPPAGQAVQASDVIGTEIVNEKGDEVGEIKDLVIDANQVEYAVVSVGGFLGIGDKEVAIPLDQLQLGMGESYLMSGETEAQLKDMPEYQQEQYQPRG